ncbi:MAG: 50S ribosomal protein L18 [Chloroflexi bacterium]|nr:50S ribosomal protein L18 [Chloroflexota bacterium]|tara:strand:- start:128 stop:481 length:354 start_codon:yes stop_codon:yes gene_type:complete
MGSKKFDTRARYIRHRRVRKKIVGLTEKPRLSVFRSNKHIHAQIIDDENGTTLVASSSLKLDEKISKIDLAKIVGEEIAEKAKSAGVKKVVFDRAGYKFHGRVKALADGARSKGLIF